MIEWIQHWEEMRFFPWSPFSWLILAPLYLGGAAVIALVCWLLAKVWKPAWLLAIPLLAVLAVAPLWEELSIAYTFGQLCKKDAGIFVYKTVEVEGFYDDTRSTHDGPRTPQAIEEYERSGYKFMEKRFRRTEQAVRVEKIDGEWKARVLDRPTARYHYKRIDWHKPVAHKVDRFENDLIDAENEDVLGRYVNYYRGAPWFFVHLDRPTIPCRETQEDTRKYGTISVYSLVFGRGPKGHVEEGEK